MVEMFRAKRSGDRPAKPKHIEIWGHLVEVNRSLKRMLLISATMALVAVTGLTWAMATALKRPLIYYVDSDGRAAFGGRLGSASQPLEVEVSYVAKEFLRRTVAYNSLTVERDFADGFNLMTAELQGQEQARFDEWQLAKGQSFVEYVRAAGIRTVVEFTAVEIENHGGERFSVRVLGTLKTWPLAGGAEAEPRHKDFESHMALVAVERTEETPNGLLVSHQSIQYFETESTTEQFAGAKGLRGEEE